jgi:hypothetical protein
VSIAINNNLSVNKIDQQFLTLRKVSQLEHKHLRTKKRSASHITPLVTPIIFHEVQTNEA